MIFVFLEHLCTSGDDSLPFIYSCIGWCVWTGVCAPLQHAEDWQLPETAWAAEGLDWGGQSGNPNTRVYQTGLPKQTFWKRPATAHVLLGKTHTLQCLSCGHYCVFYNNTLCKPTFNLGYKKEVFLIYIDIYII